MTTARMGDKGSPPRVSSRTHGFSPTNIFMDVPTKVKKIVQVPLKKELAKVMRLWR